MKRLYRSKNLRMVSGVCGGVAEYLSVDETIIRLGVALLTVMTGFFPGILFYAVATAVMPENPI